MSPAGELAGTLKGQTMRYQGSEALNEEAVAHRYVERPAEQQVERRSPLSVVPGGGLDARARAGVSPEFLMRVRAIASAVLFVIALGVVRVSLTTATVAELQSNATLKSQIEELQTTNQDLRIERSVLSSSARVSRIATQNYGMTLSTDREVIDLSTPSDDQSETSDTTADGAATTADGDAAQESTDGATASGVS
jgi:cell division protein FtsL